MDKTYNLSKLFAEDEFDAQKGYNRYGSKEAYFSVLYRFTVDSEKLLERCAELLGTGGNIDIGAISRQIVRLEGMLVNIGAVYLAWRLQSLGELLERELLTDYAKKLAEFLEDVKKLRARIIGAEIVEEELSWNAIRRAEMSGGPAGGPTAAGKPGAAESPAAAENPGAAKKPAAAVQGAAAAQQAPKRRALLRSSDFKRLNMLIDDFEHDSAIATINVLGRRGYPPEIMNMLMMMHNALDKYNYTKALEEAERLLRFVTSIEKAARPPKKCVLVIDDMADVIKTIKAMLKNKYSVFGMTNYESALKFLRSKRADVILLDVEMPELDGFAMMQIIRRIPEYENTPVVFHTSNVSDEIIKTAIGLGARDFIRKPTDVSVLVSKLENVLRQR